MPSRTGGNRLAYASLVLGAATAAVAVWGFWVSSAATGMATLAITLFFLAVGGVLALAALIVGLLALSKSDARGPAIAGLGLTAVAVIGSLLAFSGAI